LTPFPSFPQINPTKSVGQARRFGGRGMKIIYEYIYNLPTQNYSSPNCVLQLGEGREGVAQESGSGAESARERKAGTTMR